jgi:hypothetical protein
MRVVSVDEARPDAKNAIYRALTIQYNYRVISPSECISERRERATDHLPRPPLVGRRSKYRGRGWEDPAAPRVSTPHAFKSP